MNSEYCNDCECCILYHHSVMVEGLRLGMAEVHDAETSDDDGVTSSEDVCFLSLPLVLHQD